MSRSGRVGLSEHTANRLAELRARRAEAELSDGYGTQPSVPRDPSSTSIDVSASTPNRHESASSTIGATSSSAKVLTNGVSSRTGAGDVVTPESEESKMALTRMESGVSPASPETSGNRVAPPGIPVTRSYEREDVGRRSHTTTSRANPDPEYKSDLAIYGCGTSSVHCSSKLAEVSQLVISVIVKSTSYVPVLSNYTTTDSQTMWYIGAIKHNTQ